MMGRYDLFGGGNGLPIGTVQTVSSGGRLYADVETSGEVAPLGTALGNGPGGSALQARAGAFLSGSSGSVSWRGSVVRGLLTLTYMHYAGNALRLDVYGPGGAHTWLAVDETGTADDGRAAGDVVWGQAWQLLTFDVTGFPSQAGPGTYTCVLTQTGTSNAADMGWSLADYSGHAIRATSDAAGRVTLSHAPVGDWWCHEEDVPWDIIPNVTTYAAHVGAGGEDSWLSHDGAPVTVVPDRIKPGYANMGKGTVSTW